MFRARRFSPDMLQIGNIGLTLTEQYTHMTLWCIAGAPLLAGTDLVHASKETLAILANIEVRCPLLCYPWAPKSLAHH
jgi:hypothetical protein